MPKTEVEAVLQGLDGSHPVLSGLVRSIPAGARGRKRGEGFWSIAEHVAHLADVQPMLVERISRILNEDTPEFIPFLPDEEETPQEIEPPSMSDALDRFKAGREEIVRLLRGASVDDWSRQASHPEYDQYGLLILARHILMHDHWHMYRIEELWLTKDEYLTRLE